MQVKLVKVVTEAAHINNCNCDYQDYSDIQKHSVIETSDFENIDSGDFEILNRFVKDANTESSKTRYFYLLIMPTAAGFAQSSIADQIKKEKVLREELAAKIKEEKIKYEAAAKLRKAKADAKKKEKLAKQIEELTARLKAAGEIP